MIHYARFHKPDARCLISRFLYPASYTRILPLTIAEAIYRAAQKLSGCGITSARLDAEVLLSHIIERDRAWLITSLRQVRAGAHGGISLPGTLAAVAAAVIVGSAAAATHVVPWSMLPLVAAAGLLGTFIDSLLGATLERRGVIGNNGVNFAGTFAAAAIVVLLWKIRG